MERLLRVLVTGGREYGDRDRVFEFLDALDSVASIHEIIHGAARGADSLAEAWATENRRHSTSWPAQWGTHGKVAGFLRNQAMIESHPDLVVAFPGGRGTADMVRRAKAQHVPVFDLRGESERLP